MKKFFEPINFIILISIVFLLVGCQREEKLSSNFDNFKEQKYLKLSEIPEIHDFITRKIKNKTCRNAISISDIDTTRILESGISKEYRTYSLNINHDEPNKVYNIVFKK